MAAPSFLTLLQTGVKAVQAIFNGGGQTSAAYQVLSTGPDGRLDISFAPAGIGANTASLPASEAISAGALVNVWSNGGTISIRNADSTAANSGKIAHGYVQAAVASGATGTAYFSGQNTAVTGLTPASECYLGSAGAIASTGDVASGHTFQRVGYATAAGDMVWQPYAPIQC